MADRLRGFVHNCVAHPLWFLLALAADAAEVLHDLTTPEEGSP